MISSIRGFQGHPSHNYLGIWEQMFYEIEQGAHGPFYRMLDGGIHCELGFDPPPVLPGMPMSPELERLRDITICRCEGAILHGTIGCKRPPQESGHGTWKFVFFVVLSLLGVGFVFFLVVCF